MLHINFYRIKKEIIMSECTHDCNTCGGGCHFETVDGQKPRDILEELKGFMKDCENDDNLMKSFEKMAEEMEA